MYITLNPDSDMPVFRQIHDRIIEAIARGDIKDGEKLDPVRKVAAEFGINPATVQKAYDLLREDGIVTTANRSGTVVQIAQGAPSTHLQERVQASFSQEIALALLQGFSDADIRATVDNLLASYRKGTA